MQPTTANEFKWTGSGLNQLKWKKGANIADYSVSQDGPDRWVFRHGGWKTTSAVFTGENAAQALKALKTALITYRLTK